MTNAMQVVLNEADWLSIFNVNTHNLSAEDTWTEIKEKNYNIWERNLCQQLHLEINQKGTMSAQYLQNKDKWQQKKPQPVISGTLTRIQEMQNLSD